MMFRQHLCLQLLMIFLTFESLLADHRCSVRAKASSHARLAPELDLVRRGGCRFVGVCKHGEAVYDIPEDQTQRVRSMATRVAVNAPEVETKGKRLLLRYTGRNQKPGAATLKAAGLRLVEDYEPGLFLIVEPVTAISADSIEILLSDEAIEHAAPDYVMTTLPRVKTAIAAAAPTNSMPNDPLFNHLWGMKNIGATDVWPTIREAQNVVIAVIDTGVDYTHPDLRANMWSQAGQYGYDFYDNDADPRDEEDHGTHCAGTIAAVGNNGVGVVGVNWRARIMAMRFLGPDGSGATSDAVKCIDWAVANGAHILSNSWAGPDTSPQLAEAITRAERKGVLFIAAAGNTEGGHNNDAAPNYPASHRNGNIISVAAIDANNRPGSFTHYGPQTVDIGAPGVQIASTIRNGQYAKLDGTSMAAPHVAGAAALVWSASFESPQQDPTQMATVRDLIFENARPVEIVKNLWGRAAPAKVPGGVLDITFLLDEPIDDIPPPIRPRPGRKTLIERRMKVDPRVLR